MTTQDVENPDQLGQADEQIPRPRRNTRAKIRFISMTLVSIYLIEIVTVAGLIKPITDLWLAIVAVTPWAVGFVAGLILFLRCRPRRGILALSHLGIYPLIGLATLGLPGAFITCQLSRVFGG